MSIAHVQTVTAISSTDATIEQVQATTIVGTLTVTLGSLLCVAVTWADDTNTVVASVADDNSGSWTQLGTTMRSVSDHQAFAIFYAPNHAAGATNVTVTFDASVGWRRLAVSEYSGLATSPLDQVATPVAAGSTVATTDGNVSGSITPTVPGCLIYGAAVEIDDNNDFAAGTGWTERANVNPSIGNGGQLEVEDLVQVIAAPITAKWTVPRVGDSFHAIVASFKPTAVAPPTPSISLGGQSKHRPAMFKPGTPR